MSSENLLAICQETPAIHLILQIPQGNLLGQIRKNIVGKPGETSTMDTIFLKTPQILQTSPMEPLPVTRSSDAMRTTITPITLTNPILQTSQIPEIPTFSQEILRTKILFFVSTRHQNSIISSTMTKISQETLLMRMALLFTLTYSQKPLISKGLKAINN